MQDLGINVLFLGNNFWRLLEGLWVTIQISLISIGLSIPFGIMFGGLMSSKNPVLRLFTRCYLEAMRIMPQLVLLFLVYFGFSNLSGIHISGEVAAVVVFTLWGTAELGDIVRASLQSIPKHQYESAEAIGLSKIQTYGYVILPQAIRRMIPASVNLTTRMIKTTSLVSLIGVIEVVKVGKQIIDASRYEVPTAAFWIFAVILVLYFSVCYPLSLWSKKLEEKYVN